MDWWKDDPVANATGDEFWANDPVAGEQSAGLATSAAYSTQGINRALTDALGAPVDAANFVLRQIGVPTNPDHALGSRGLRRGLNSAMAWAKKQLGIGDPDFKAAYDDINDVPDAYRPAVRVGEVTGATVSGLVPLGIAARGVSAADAARMAVPREGLRSVPGNVWRGSVAEMATAPQATLVKQLPVTAGTAAGAYAAETLFPGSETAQLLGQLAGGGLGAIASAGSSKATQEGGGLISRITEPFTTKTEAGLKSAAGRALGPKLAEAGESADDIIARLQRTPVVPGQVAVDRAQSPLLTGVADELAQSNPSLANAVTTGRRVYESNLQTGTREAFEPGKAGALTGVARAREADFNKMLDDWIGTAERKAQQALSKAGPTGTQTKAALSMRARNILDQAVQRARRTENQLWGRVDNSLPVTLRNTNGVYTQVRSEMLDEQRLPTVIESAILRLSSANASPTFGDLKNLRSELLNQARSLRSGATPDFNMARRLDDLADGVLDDMGSINAPGVDTARSYSRALNDRLTRSFVGDLLGRKGTGAARVRPELTLEAATTGSPEKVAAQLRELQTGAVPLRVQAGQAATALQPARELQGTIDQYLRLNAQKALQSGSAKQIEKFVADNQTVLDQFPGLRAQLETAARSQSVLDDVLKTTGDLRTQAQKTAAFAQVIKAGEDPSAAVAQVLSGNAPVADLKKLAQLARTGGDEAIGGLRAAVLKHVTDSSMVGDSFSFAKATQRLYAPLSPEGPSLLKSLRDNGIINATQYARIGQHLDAGLANEVSKVTGLKVGSIGNDPGMWLEAAARIVGAKVATASGAGSGGAGNSLQAAQLGANIAKKMLGKLPKDRVKNFIADAMSADDPAVLIEILERSAASALPKGKAIPADTMRLLMALRASMVPSDQTEPVWEGQDPSPGSLNITIRK